MQHIWKDSSSEQGIYITHSIFAASTKATKKYLTEIWKWTKANEQHWTQTFGEYQSQMGPFLGKN